MSILADGWRRRLIGFLAGACGALALAPVNFLPAMIVPMTIAIWLIDGAAEAKQSPAAPFCARLRVRNAFGAGWWWGFGYFVAGFWWLGAAFLVEPQDFVWAMPLGIFGLPAFLGSVSGIGLRPGAARLVAGPCPHPDAGGRARFQRMAARRTCSPAFPGTITGWRSAIISCWRNSRRSAAWPRLMF